jgi:hypothetical protein
MTKLEWCLLIAGIILDLLIVHFAIATVKCAKGHEVFNLPYLTKLGLVNPQDKK